MNIKNTGNMNTGDRNTGDMNIGDMNTGDRNTGDLNTGNRNTGNMNTGNLNTGNWNTGNMNTGNLNTNKPKLRIFNKDTDVEIGNINFPDFFYFNLIKWIDERDMTNKEKEAFPTYVITGGYLKCYAYQQAFKDSWKGATLEDKKKVVDLPNFDNEIFKEISGIDVGKELNPKRHKIKIDNKEIEISEESYRELKVSLK